MELKKTIAVSVLFLVLVFQMFTAAALTSYEAKQNWFDARAISREKQEEHRDAKIEYAANPNPENKQDVIDTGKEVLHAALNEVEAWLIWRNLEVEENPEIPSNLKEDIQEDVDRNLRVIEDLRDDVDGIETRLDLGIVFLQMIGKYIELVTDVARNSGKVWVHVGNTLLDRAEDYETKLREAAEEMLNNEEILEKLDLAQEDLDEARENVDSAEQSYLQVVLPGTPLQKFQEGNNYMRTAKSNLISAHNNLNQAYRLIVWGGQ